MKLPNEMAKYFSEQEGEICGKKSSQARALQYQPISRIYSCPRIVGG